MRTFILLLALTACVFGQQRPRCTSSPSQWVAEIHESNHENRNPNRPVIRRADFYYDANNERIRINEIELLEPGDRTARYVDLLIYANRGPRDKGTLYRVNIATRQCEKFNLTEEFRPVGVRSDFTFRGIDFLGSVAGLLVDSFSGEIPGTDSVTDYHGFWAPIPELITECVPIIESYRDRENGQPTFATTNIYRTYRNIKPVSESSPFPPGIFDIPEDCLS